MLAKLSIDQGIMKARFNLNNIRAQRKLSASNNHTEYNAIQTPPLETLNQLVNLYNQGQIFRVIQQVKSIIKQYPQAFVVWNILGAAKIRNIYASRIVFADELPMNEHLNRHKLADLFIEMFSFNAHTTASEALWSGLHVFSKQGQGFAARVVASLLNAI